MASAKNTFHYAQRDLFEVAASYAFHLAQAQVFIDGNKRTGVASALTFPAMNGVHSQPPQLDLYAATIAIAVKKKTKTDPAAIFREGAEPFR